MWKCGGAPSTENCGMIMVSSYQICGGHGGTKMGFSQYFGLVSPQNHSTNFPYSLTHLSLMPHNIST